MGQIIWITKLRTDLVTSEFKKEQEEIETIAWNNIHQRHVCQVRVSFLVLKLGSELSSDFAFLHLEGKPQRKLPNKHWTWVAERLHFDIRNVYGLSKKWKPISNKRRAKVTLVKGNGFNLIYSAIYKCSLVLESGPVMALMVGQVVLAPSFWLMKQTPLWVRMCLEPK